MLLTVRLAAWGLGCSLQLSPACSPGLLLLAWHACQAGGPLPQLAVQQHAAPHEARGPGLRLEPAGRLCALQEGGALVHLLRLLRHNISFVT